MKRIKKGTSTYFQEKEKLSATLNFFVEKKSEKQILYSDF